MKHKSHIIRYAEIEEKEFSQEVIATLKKLNQEKGIVFTDQLCPFGYDTDLNIQDSHSWQELNRLKIWLEENGFNAFSIAEPGRACKIQSINEILLCEEVKHNAKPHYISNVNVGMHISPDERIMLDEIAKHKLQRK